MPVAQTSACVIPFVHPELTREPRRSGSPQTEVCATKILPRRWASEDLRFLSRRGRLGRAGLAPAVEARQVARVPGLAKSRGAEVPVRTDFARNGAQIVPQVRDRRPAPEPV